MKTRNLRRGIFLFIAIISFIVVSYVSYKNIVYGNGSWDLNQRHGDSKEILLFFLIPVLFFLNSYSYRKVEANNVNISTVFFVCHVAVSLSAFLLFCLFSFRDRNGGLPFSIYSIHLMTIYKTGYYSLILILCIVLLILLKKASAPN
jgi:hypothetical protein